MAASGTVEDLLVGGFDGMAPDQKLNLLLARVKAGEEKAESLRLQLSVAQEATVKAAQPRSVVDADGLAFLFTKTVSESLKRSQVIRRLCDKVWIVAHLSDEGSKVDVKSMFHQAQHVLTTSLSGLGGEDSPVVFSCGPAMVRRAAARLFSGAYGGGFAEVWSSFPVFSAW